MVQEDQFYGKEGERNHEGYRDCLKLSIHRPLSWQIFVGREVYRWKEGLAWSQKGGVIRCTCATINPRRRHTFALSATKNVHTEFINARCRPYLLQIDTPEQWQSLRPIKSQEIRVHSSARAPAVQSIRTRQQATGQYRSTDNSQMPHSMHLPLVLQSRCALVGPLNTAGSLKMTTLNVRALIGIVLPIHLA